MVGSQRLTPHYKDDCTFERPVLQRPQALVFRDVEKGYMIRWVTPRQFLHMWVRNVWAWMLDRCSVPVALLCFCGGFDLAGSASTCPCKGMGHCKSAQWPLGNLLYPVMKNSHSNGNCLFQHDSVYIHGTQGVTEWFDDKGKDVDNMQRRSQSTDRYRTEHRFWNNMLDGALDNHPHTRWGNIIWTNGFIPPVEFREEAKSTPKCIEALLAAHGCLFSPH